MAKTSHMAKSRVNTNDHTGVTAAGHMTDWELANVSLLYPLSIPSRIFSTWPQIIIFGSIYDSFYQAFIFQGLSAGI